MNIKDLLNKNLWDVINVHYEKECYTDCLKDACLYLVQLIQERSEVEDLDGEKLITNVFSDKSPKLLVNDNQTQTEKDIQRGIGYLLRGIICSVRNPISHDNNVVFTKEETDSVLLFISSFLLNKLDNSKDFGYVENWFDFIFIDNVTDSIKYSDTILSKISKKDKYALSIEIINRLDEIPNKKYKYFINSLFSTLKTKEQDELIICLNKKLINAGNDKFLASFFAHFDCSIWKKLDDLIKVRIEELIFDDIDKAGYGKLFIGNLATWTVNWIDVFSNSDDVYELLFNKLFDFSSDYVLKNFYHIMAREDKIFQFKDIINKGLKEGKIGYKNFLDKVFSQNIISDKITMIFKDAYDNFVDDELPF